MTLEAPWWSLYQNSRFLMMASSMILCLLPPFFVFALSWVLVALSFALLLFPGVLARLLRPARVEGGGPEPPGFAGARTQFRATLKGLSFSCLLALFAV